MKTQQDIKVRTLRTFPLHRDAERAMSEALRANPDAVMMGSRAIEFGGQLTLFYRVRDTYDVRRLQGQEFHYVRVHNGIHPQFEARLRAMARLLEDEPTS